MFPLDPGHPLYGKYEAVIRIQFRTAVLAGHLPPTAGYCIIIIGPVAACGPISGAIISYVGVDKTIYVP